MRIIHISDTHTKHEELILPEGDMIIHSGDFSGSLASGYCFFEWFEGLDYKYKILVAGNHDSILAMHNNVKEKQMELAKRGIIYLEDSSIEIEGIKFHGSPWTLNYGNYNFMCSEQQIAFYWEKIPNDTNILITHSPAFGILDVAPDKTGLKNLGSSSLRYKAESLKDLKYHLIGHIHEGYGIDKGDDYTTINSSIFILKGKLRKPHVFDVVI